jgi:hypothetical protein
MDEDYGATLTASQYIAIFSRSPNQANSATTAAILSANRISQFILSLATAPPFTRESQLEPHKL